MITSDTAGDSDIELYKLYYREIGNDGMWMISDAVATEISSSSITFSGISEGGQYILAK